MRKFLTLLVLVAVLVPLCLTSCGPGKENDPPEPTLEEKIANSFSNGSENLVLDGKFKFSIEQNSTSLGVSIKMFYAKNGTKEMETIDLSALLGANSVMSTVYIDNTLYIDDLDTKVRINDMTPNDYLEYENLIISDDRAEGDNAVLAKFLSNGTLTTSSDGTTTVSERNVALKDALDVASFMDLNEIICLYLGLYSLNEVDDGNVSAYIEMDGDGNAQKVNIKFELMPDASVPDPVIYLCEFDLDVFYDEHEITKPTNETEYYYLSKENFFAKTKIEANYKKNIKGNSFELELSEVETIKNHSSTVSKSNTDTVIKTNGTDYYCSVASSSQSGLNKSIHEIYYIDGAVHNYVNKALYGKVEKKPFEETDISILMDLFFDMSFSYSDFFSCYIQNSGTSTIYKIYLPAESVDLFSTNEYIAEKVTFEITMDSKNCMTALRQTVQYRHATYGSVSAEYTINATITNVGKEVKVPTWLDNSPSIIIK